MIYYTVNLKIINRKGSESYRKVFSLTNEIFTNPLHIIYPYMWADDSFTKSIIQLSMKTIGLESALVTTVWMAKEKCITKEQFDILYGITNEEGEIKTDNLEVRDDLSVGEDLETFIQRIKNGEITKEIFPEGDDKKTSYLLCLLDKEERRKLDRKDQKFFETFFTGTDADVPEDEWKKTEFKHLKFSRSFASRKTYFIDTEVEAEEVVSEDESSDSSWDGSLDGLLEGLLDTLPDGLLDTLLDELAESSGCSDIEQ